MRFLAKKRTEVARRNAQARGLGSLASVSASRVSRVARELRAARLCNCVAENWNKPSRDSRALWLIAPRVSLLHSDGL